MRHLDRFVDIFYNNCFKNGILAVKVTPEDLAKLMDDAERGANATLTVDLPAQEIRGPDGGVVRFEIEAFRKHCLVEGLDDIGLSMVDAGDRSPRGKLRDDASMAMSSKKSRLPPIARFASVPLICQGAPSANILGKTKGGLSLR